jgi:hypothetical protein
MQWHVQTGHFGWIIQDDSSKVNESWLQPTSIHLHLGLIHPKWHVYTGHFGWNIQDDSTKVNETWLQPTSINLHLELIHPT